MTMKSKNGLHIHYTYTVHGIIQYSLCFTSESDYVIEDGWGSDALLTIIFCVTFNSFWNTLNLAGLNLHFLFYFYKWEKKTFSITVKRASSPPPPQEVSDYSGSNHKTHFTQYFQTKPNPCATGPPFACLLGAHNLYLKEQYL